MTLSTYDIQRISEAIVTKLLCDDKFISQVMKARKSDRMLNTRQAASLLGISRKSVCDIAMYIGGIRGEGKSAHWTFPEDGLKDRYIEYKQRKKTGGKEMT